MKAAILFICLAVTIQQTTVLSQSILKNAAYALYNSIPGTLPESQPTNVPIVPTPIPNVAAPVVSPGGLTTHALVTYLSQDFSGLGFELPFSATIGSMRDLSYAVVQGDSLMAGMKLVELMRTILVLWPFPGFKKVDTFLELLHGVLEALHPIWKQLASNGIGQVAPVSVQPVEPVMEVPQNVYLTNGMRFASLISKMLM